MTYGNDLSANANRFGSGEGEDIAVGGNSLPVNFVRISRVIANRIDGCSHISEGIIEWLSVVECLQTGQVVDVPLHEISQSEQKATPVRGINSSPNGSLCSTNI